MEVGQDLYDAAKAYLAWNRRWRKAGGVMSPALNRQWFEAVTQMWRASKAAMQGVSEETEAER